MSDTSSSAALAAKQVQAIIEAAEASAREIRQKARADADEMVAGLTAAVTAMRAELDTMLARLEEIRSSVENAEPEPIVAEPAPEPIAAEPDPEPAPADPAPAPADSASRASEGARLIALNMALSGTPRDETARYLRENFDLDDADNLLDEVYARVGG